MEPGFMEILQEMHASFRDHLHLYLPVKKIYVLEALLQSFGVIKEII